jgi:hypothetical protein
MMFNNLKSTTYNSDLSNVDDLTKIIKQLSLEKKILLETIELKLNENELLKKNEVKLMAKCNYLNEELKNAADLIEKKSKNEMNLSNRVKKLELMQKILLEDKLIDTERDIESDDESNTCQSLNKSKSNLIIIIIILIEIIKIILHFSG